MGEDSNILKITEADLKGDCVRLNRVISTVLDHIKDPVIDLSNPSEVNGSKLKSDLIAWDGTKVVNASNKLFVSSINGQTGDITLSGSIFYGTHSVRLTKSAADSDGAIFVETDRGMSAYQAQSGAWVYLRGSGPMSGDISQAPSGLGATDAGFMFHVTAGHGATASQKYNHTVSWNGSGWEPAEREQIGGFFASYAKVPTELGWQLCDGTTVHFLDISGGALVEVSFTTPNWTGNPSYLKMGSPYDGTIRPATPPTNPATGTGHASLGNNSANASAGAAGSGAAANPHTHTDAGHTHTIAAPTLPDDPVQYSIVLPYFRC